MSDTGPRALVNLAKACAEGRVRVRAQGTMHVPGPTHYTGRMAPSLEFSVARSPFCPGAADIADGLRQIAGTEGVSIYLGFDGPNWEPGDVVTVELSSHADRGRILAVLFGPGGSHDPTE